MGKKGKGQRHNEEDQQPSKKKNMITEEQLMDKTHMDRTQFIPLLVTESLYDPFIFSDQSERLVQKIVCDLNHLLYVDFKCFWATVLYNPTLKNCLSSCLSYLHRRSLNSYHYSNQEEQQFQKDEDNLINYKRVKQQAIYEYTQGIFKVLLLIYHRIVSFAQQNKELSDLYRINEEISRKYILDFPKLFEIIEIYGETNSPIVQYIINMFAKTMNNFYNYFTDTILPIYFKRADELIRFTKALTEREQFGVNYSYKRMNGKDLSQGEEQLKKKTILLMEMIGFVNIIKSIINYFPEICTDHCYYNGKIQFYFENIFLQLQAAYKVWNYQGQQSKLLNMMNYVMKECINYFINYFDRCNDILVLRSRKSSTVQAYINSLERIYKDFGRRNSVGKKNQVRNLLMYKIVNKKIDILTMAQTIYAIGQEQQEDMINPEYLKDFIINIENEVKEEYIEQQEPRQEEIQEETQAPQQDQQDDFQEIEDKMEIPSQNKKKQKKQETKPTQRQLNLEDLQMLVPKRNRSEDYYHKLYSDFNVKHYKGQYEDDYDDIADFDKRPLYYEQQSSDTESQAEMQKHLVSNQNNLQHVKYIHKAHQPYGQQSNKPNVTQKPKYERVQNGHQQYRNNQKKELADNREKKQKTKYVAKQKEQNGADEPQNRQDRRPQQRQRQPAVEQVLLQERRQQQRRNPQQYHKNNKSHNYVPKDKTHKPKNTNTNKNREYQKGNNRGAGNRY